MSESLFRVSKDKEYVCNLCKDTGYRLDGSKVSKCTCVMGTKGVILDEETIDEITIDIIPEEYRGIIFEPDKIKNDPRIEMYIKNDPMFDYYIDSITEIYNKINVGEKLKYSVLITAPQGLGKAHFVYACMNAGIRGGLDVAPYLDCLEIYDLLNLTSDMRYGNKRRQNEAFEKLDKIYNSDVCFIKIPTGLTIQHNTTQTLKLVVDRRARKGLYTIVTSRFPVTYIYATEVNLDRFIITGNYGNEKFDYSRLRVITAPMTDLNVYDNKYRVKKKSW